MNSQSRTPQLINNSSNEERPPECSGCKDGLGRASKQNCCRELEVSSNAMAIAGNFQVRCKDVKRK